MDLLSQRRDQQHTLKLARGFALELKGMRQMNKDVSKLDPWAVGWTIKALVLIAFVAAFAVTMGFAPIVTFATNEGNGSVLVNGTVSIPLSTLEPTQTIEPLTPTPHVPRLGIIAGHTGSDSGAVCPDGLQEVDINTDVARRVVALLTERYNWQVDLFEEFDERLNNYQADALISIHADSCSVPGKSGFKVARAESSYTPETEDLLVECISQSYHERTGLNFDADTITYDMRQYHAYYEIHKGTPAAIIEIGFMLDDREILTQRADVVAEGIVDGLVCFITSSAP